MEPSWDLAVLWTALLLGLRHSLDVDHLAATADIAGAQSSRSKAIWGCVGYALGHAGIVLLLGGISISLGLSLPDSFGAVMEKIVGLTLLVLAGAIVYSALRFGQEGKILSRWRILHNLTHKLIEKLRLRPKSDTSKGPGSDDLSFRGCVLIGILHGVGVESPTQLLALASAATLGNKVVGFSLLGLFVAGMIISNMAVAFLAVHGFQSAKRRNAIFIGLSLISAAFSAVLGVQLLLS